MRIDHCYIRYNQYSIRTYSSRIYGVIDHNYIYNNDAFANLVGNAQNWDLPSVAGTTNTLMFEDNIHYLDDHVTDVSGWTDQEQFIEGQGQDFSIRNCLFDGRNLTKYNGLFVEWHGNASLHANDPALRGPQLIEVYSNQFLANFSYRMIHARGGSLLCWSNVFSSASRSGAAIQMEEEESGASCCRPLKTIWAAEDQINNTHIWGNTLRGAVRVLVATNYANDSIFIQKDRDYFLHAPDGTSGKTSWSDRLGASNMTHTARGTQYHHPYTPLVHPHPLVFSQDGGQ